MNRAARLWKKNPLVMRARRAIRNPFDNDEQYVIVHTGHHKVGTSWFRCVFTQLSEEFGVPFYHGRDGYLPTGKRVLYFQSPTMIEPSSLPAYRGSHMIRDPRDVVVSGYHYHKWTKEIWARTKIRDLPEDVTQAWSLLPIDDIKDMSYQEYLNSLSKEDGLIAEIQWASCKPIKEMLEWNYEDENIFEFKYEDIMSHEEQVFLDMFRHFGFREAVLDRALAAAKRCSFSNRTGRRLGEAQEKSHMRSGQLRQWQSEFSPRHREYFKSLHGEALIRLGYESDLDW